MAETHPIVFAHIYEEGYDLRLRRRRHKLSSIPYHNLPLLLLNAKGGFNVYAPSAT